MECFGQRVHVMLVEEREKVQRGGKAALLWGLFCFFVVWCQGWCAVGGVFGPDEEIV